MDLYIYPQMQDDLNEKGHLEKMQIFCFINHVNCMNFKSNLIKYKI